MTMEPVFYNPSEWERGTRGSSFQFYVTDDDLARYLHNLPPQFAPYGMIGTSLVKGERRYEHEAFGLGVDDWSSRLREGRLPPSSNFWLWSSVAPRVIPNHNSPAWCSVNGLLQVRHGDERAGKRSVSWVALVSKIYSNKTGEGHEHVRQAALFRSLKRVITRDLVFATMCRFPDGRQVEDDRTRMTAAAAELALTGFFDRMPGRRIERRSERRSNRSK